MKMILFDIDGTLLLAGGVGRTAFERVFEKLFSISNAWGEVHPDGKTDPVIIEEITARVLGRKPTQEEHEQIHDHYCQYFAEEIDHSPRFRVLTGVELLLKELSAQKNILMGLATGNFEKTSWMKLKRAKLESHFAFGGYGSDSIVRHELVKKAAERGEIFSGKKFSTKDIFVIGDSIHDIRAAKTLGFRSIAVATGSTSLKMLEAESPDGLLKDLNSPVAFLSLLG